MASPTTGGFDSWTAVQDRCLLAFPAGPAPHRAGPDSARPSAVLADERPVASVARVEWCHPWFFLSEWGWRPWSRGLRPATIKAHPACAPVAMSSAKDISWPHSRHTARCSPPVCETSETRETFSCFCWSGGSFAVSAVFRLFRLSETREPERNALTCDVLLVSAVSSPDGPLRVRFIGDGDLCQFCREGRVAANSSAPALSVVLCACSDFSGTTKAAGSRTPSQRPDAVRGDRRWTVAAVTPSPRRRRRDGRPRGHREASSARHTPSTGRLCVPRVPRA